MDAPKGCLRSCFAFAADQISKGIGVDWSENIFPNNELRLATTLRLLTGQRTLSMAIKSGRKKFREHLRLIMGSLEFIVL